MKNKIFLFLLPLLAAAWLVSCHRDEARKTILHGRVTEYGTGKAVADARIYVGCEESVPFGPTTFTLVDSLITDADGKFYKEYAEADLCASVSMLPYKKGYFKGTPLYPTTDNKAFEVVLDPEAWLKVVAVPDEGEFGISIGGGFFGSGYSVYATDGVSQRVFMIRGNRGQKIFWSPIGKIDQLKQDTIYLPAHDTTTYTIHY